MENPNVFVIHITTESFVKPICAPVIASMDFVIRKRMPMMKTSSNAFAMPATAETDVKSKTRNAKRSASTTALVFQILKL